MLLIGAIFAMTLGIVFIMGGVKRWRFLIDPPEKLIFQHPLSFLRCFFSLKQMPWVTASVGLIYVVMGVWLLVMWYRDS
jgi:hypothetical protein